MTRLLGDEVARPKRPLPTSSMAQPASGASVAAPEVVSAAASSRSGREGADRPERSPEFYSGTSLRRPPPPRDPARDPRLPLPGSPGDVRHWEAACLRRKDVDREDALRAELEPHPPSVARAWDPQDPREPASRATATRPSEPEWRRGRGGSPREVCRSARDPLRDEHRRPAHAAGRRSVWRSSRADGPDRRRDGRSPGRRSPGHRSAELSAVPAMAKKKKKKKPKKKKPPGVTPGVAGCPAPVGAPEQDELAAYIGDFRDVEFTWEVTETAPLVFSVPFPSVELLRVCSHDFIRCPINKFLISVRAATAEPELVPPLEKIDGLSLIFYFGSRGRRLTFELESSAVIDLHSLAPGASVLGDDRREGDGGSSEESSFCEEDVGIGGVPPAASDGRRTPSSTAVGPSSSAGVASRVASGIEPVIIAGSSPVVIDLVVQDGVEVQGGSSPVATTADDLEFTEADVLSVGMEVCPSSSPCSPGVVCYSRSTGSPSLALGSPDRVPPPPLDLVISVVTPKAADSKARGEVSPVVSER
ncbi:hypothetical protein ZWY2020_044283 [Hordeum vulgare]|nr:hypothetical protein ZWY2020_044283 [Hordeum vulgare]